MCDYCNNQDTIIHFLYECPKVQNLWVQFSTWFETQTNVNLNVSPQEYMLGMVTNRNNVRVINTLILYFKFFVFRQKLFHNCELNLLALLAEVKSKITTEKFICTAQNKASHFDSWKDILHALG